jgi:hypothetical protein
MALPDKVTPAQTKENVRSRWDQPGGQTFRNGNRFDSPATYPSGPASVTDTPKLSTYEDRSRSNDASGSGLPSSVSPADSAARSNAQYVPAEKYQPVENFAFGGHNVVREGAEQTVPTLGAPFFPARKEYDRADPDLTTPTFWVTDPAPSNVLAHAPKPFDRSEEEK